MHKKSTANYPGSDPHFILRFWSQDWEWMMKLEVRYKGPGLHITYLYVSPGFIMEGGDRAEFSKEIDSAYNELVDNRCYQK